MRFLFFRNNRAYSEVDYYNVGENVNDYETSYIPTQTKKPDKHLKLSKRTIKSLENKVGYPLLPINQTQNKISVIGKK